MRTAPGEVMSRVGHDVHRSSEIYFREAEALCDSRYYGLLGAFFSPR